MGNTDFYGKGLTVDTSKKFTVVSQFTPDKLTMFFLQDGKKIEMPAPKWEGIPQDNGDLTPAFCSNAPAAFGDRDRFEEVGGFSQLNAALQVPMVLVMSIWDDVSLPFLQPQHPKAHMCTYSPGPLPPHTKRREKKRKTDIHKHYSNMLWLDSIYPPEKEGEPGAARGPCSQDSGVPSEVEAEFPNAKVIYSNIRFGPIGSTV